MKENVAISKKKQKSFETSVDNYKKLLKEGKLSVEENVLPEKKKEKTRGIVFLSNIPHGFYEEEMKQYFRQFGAVTKIRLARSKNTGRSKGYAFIEFAVAEVAKIVAETMNNYLMLKHLLKASYIPPEDQHEFYFKGKDWTTEKYPKLISRQKNLKRENKVKTDKEVLKTAKKLLKSVDDVKKKLLSVGIIYNFEPVDIPNELKKDNKISENENSDTENEQPTLFLDDSDSDIEFNPPSDIKTVVMSKLKADESPNITKTKTNLKTKTSKLTGVAKKNKGKIVKVNKDSKKMKLIQKNILEDSQINLRSMKDIKKNNKK